MGQKLGSNNYYVLFVDDVMLRKHNEVLLCEILYDEMGYDPGWLDRSEDWVVWLNEV